MTTSHPSALVSRPFIVKFFLIRFICLSVFSPFVYDLKLDAFGLYNSFEASVISLDVQFKLLLKLCRHTQTFSYSVPLRLSPSLFENLDSNISLPSNVF